MKALTLRFSRPQESGDVYRLELDSSTGEASGAFTRPFDDLTWTAGVRPPSNSPRHAGGGLFTSLPQSGRE